MQGFSPKLPLQADSIDGLYGMNKTALESIKQDLKMLVLTSPGERIMLPDYGVGIKNFLFEQNNVSTKNSIEKAIRGQIAKYMNFITLENIEINDIKLNDYAISVRIIYYVPSLNAKQELNLSLNSN